MANLWVAVAVSGTGSGVADGPPITTVIDAVGVEAHGSPAGKLAQQIAGLLPDALEARVMETAGVDRLAALHLAVGVPAVAARPSRFVRRLPGIGRTEVR